VLSAIVQGAGEQLPSVASMRFCYRRARRRGGADAAPPVASFTAQLSVNGTSDLRTLGDDTLRNSNALDDLRSALYA